ncbi:MAG TPA: four helix bundle protein [Cyclobacteriaceae bacterium]|nr:four helix bundle protein [Cyclobacteriaceae bacterium]
MPFAKNFRDLETYKFARVLQRQVFELSQKFPIEEKYSLTDQVRRSSRSIGAQIAEAWGKRRYERNFISKLTDADSEQLETQHWIDSALDFNYIDTESCNNLIRQYEHLGSMINNMINKSSDFCTGEQA